LSSLVVSKEKSGKGEAAKGVVFYYLGKRGEQIKAKSHIVTYSSGGLARGILDNCGGRSFL